MKKLNPVRSNQPRVDAGLQAGRTSNGVNRTEFEKILKNNGIGVLATDTIYGLVGSALSKKAVKRIYKVKQRRGNKPFIILITSFKDLEFFDIKLSRRVLKLWQKIIPFGVSVILPCPSKKFYYLHRGSNSLAFRIPKNSQFKKILSKVGPLVAPSANLEGMPPAETISEAKKYFGDKVYPERDRKIDFYNDEGRIKGKPSIIMELKRQ